MKKHQVEKEIQRLHENWIQAIKDTPGVGPILFKRIMENREQIARRTVHG